MTAATATVATGSVEECAIFVGFAGGVARAAEAAAADAGGGGASTFVRVSAIAAKTDTSTKTQATTTRMSTSKLDHPCGQINASVTPTPATAAVKAKTPNHGRFWPSDTGAG